MRPFHRILCVLLAVIFFCSFLGCKYTANSTAAPELLDVTGFRDIPGVTEDEITAIEAVISARSEFTCVVMPSTSCFLTEDGRIAGFSSLMCEWMSDLFGITFKPVMLEWDMLITDLIYQGYDFSVDIPTYWRDDERFFVTDAIIDHSMVTFFAPHIGAQSISDSDLPLRYGHLRRRDIPDSIATYLDKNYIAVPVDNLKKANEMLALGTLDAFIGEASFESQLTAHSSSEVISGLAYDPLSLATCDPELEAFISVVQKYILSNGSYLFKSLKEEGHYQYLHEKLMAQLTPEEREYLIVHQNPAAVIPVGLEYDNYPFSFYNEQEDEWQGIGVDLLEKLEQLTGMYFGVASSRNLSWGELISQLQNGALSMMPELIRTPAREASFIWSEPYLVDSYAFLSMQDYPDLNISQISNSRVGLIEGAAYTELFLDTFPHHVNVAYFQNKLDAFDALERGEVDLLMLTRHLLLSATNYLERTGIKENLVLDRPYESAFGFNKNQTELRSIVNKAQALIDTDEIVNSWTRKVFDYRGKLARAQVPYLIGAAVLLLCVLVLLAILLVRNLQMGRHLAVIVDQRTKELQKRTSELELQTQTAQTASRAKSEFLARMSHEIRTPLNAIVGMTEITRRSVDTDKAKALSSLGEIKTASNHLMGILNDILDMSKIESGKFKLADDAFALSAAMDDVIKIILPRCTEKSIDFIADFDSALACTVSGDKLRIKQVLINLLGNAVKFTPEGGKIEFTARAAETADEHITIGFSIADNGIGITEEQQKRLFKTFEQADSTIAARFGGTGLGLAISQNLVNQMGGEISLESVYGEGSTFSFTLELPLLEAQVNEECVDDIGEAHFAGKRVLLVEDIDINRLIFIELMAHTMLEIDEAVDGLDAIKKFTATEPGYYDLVLMDVQMPNMGGYEATRSIRALERPDAEIPIIAMTANAYRDDIEDALAAGMNEHLAKPINIENVISAIQRWI